MSISVNHLYNRLLSASKQEMGTRDSGSLSFALSRAWEPERKLIHDNPHILDELSNAVMRNGGVEGHNAYLEMVRKLTLRMPSHGFMKDSPGVLLGVTAHVLQLKGLHLSTLGDLHQVIANEIATMIGAKAEHVRVSKRVISAEAAYRMSPHQVYNTVCSVLGEFQGHSVFPAFRNKNTLHTIPSPAEAKAKHQEYVFFVYVATPLGGLAPSHAVRNAISALPRGIPPVGVSIETNKGPAEAKIAITLFTAATPWGALTSSLYTSSMSKVLSACYSIVNGPEMIGKLERPTGEVLGRALAGIELYAVALANDHDKGPSMRITVSEGNSGEVLGGLLIEGVTEPHSMLMKMQSFFSNRLQYERAVVDDYPKNTPEGGVYFLNPRNGTWTIPNMAMQFQA